MTPRRSQAPSRDQPLPAHQKRSQATVERLLAAAERALAEDGVDGATLRAIADRADVSLGIVYRRFPDKDAVLRAVYVRFFERSKAANEQALGSEKWSGGPAADVAARLIRGMIAGYQTHRRLIRALLIYAYTHEDADFRARAAESRTHGFEGIGAIFEPHFQEMDHPDPAQAVTFALTVVASALQQQILIPTSRSHGADHLTDMAPELTRLFTRYLGLPTASPPRRRKARAPKGRTR